jgi:homoserine kinase
MIVAAYHMPMVRFIADPVRVRVPATSANLGPGFDCFGLALSLYDTVVASAAGDGVRVSVAGEGAGELDCDETHLVVRCMLATFDLLGGCPAGLDVTCVNEIPQARGLGSSSAAIISGILAARALVAGGAERLPGTEVLKLASELEGHPDNVAPCLLGGFTIAWIEAENGARAARLEVTNGIHPMIFIPEHRGLTAHARAALPAVVPLPDAAGNAGRAALLVHALTAAPHLLLPATEDRLHQGYRAAGAPETADLVATLRRAGIPAVVSGAGPSVLALLADQPSAAGASADQSPAASAGSTGATSAIDVAEVAKALVPPCWRTRMPEVDTRGAQVGVDWEHAERNPVAAGRAS